MVYKQLTQVYNNFHRHPQRSGISCAFTIRQWKTINAKTIRKFQFLTTVNIPQRVNIHFTHWLTTSQKYKQMQTHRLCSMITQLLYRC